MKNTNFIVFAVIGAVVCLLTTGCNKKKPPSKSTARSPFQSVVVRDDAIVATLPNAARWVVIDGSDKRRTEPNEAFTLKDGSSLKLVHRHVNYSVTAELTPRKGLTIEYEFDGTSFGDGVTQSEFFIEAKTTTPNDANKAEMATPRKPSD